MKEDNSACLKTTLLIFLFGLFDHINELRVFSSDYELSSPFSGADSYDFSAPGTGQSDNSFDSVISLIKQSEATWIIT
mgnify:CR=1 FL=1